MVGSNRYIKAKGPSMTTKGPNLFMMDASIQYRHLVSTYCTTAMYSTVRTVPPLTTPIYFKSSPPPLLDKRSDLVSQYYVLLASSLCIIVP